MIAWDFNCGMGVSLATDKNARWFGTRLAPRAQHSFEAWGIAPGSVEFTTASAEGAIQFLHQLDHHFRHDLNRAFSAGLPGRSNPWGDAPGWRETAPSALTHIRHALS